MSIDKSSNFGQFTFVGPLQGDRVLGPLTEEGVVHDVVGGQGDGSLPQDGRRRLVIFHHTLDFPLRIKVSNLLLFLISEVMSLRSRAG